MLSVFVFLSNPSPLNMSAVATMIAEKMVEKKTNLPFVIGHPDTC